jgi:CBS domain-containing protein
MQVRDLMTTGVLTVRETDDVRTVVAKMLNRQCGAIPVIEGDMNLVGLVAVRDILIQLYPNCGAYIHDTVRSRDFVDMERGYGELLSSQVVHVMTRNPFSVAPDDPVLKAASYMGLKHFRRIPVVDNARLVGMISIGDINRGLFLAHMR